jgi:cytoskeletal protein CcmA (bactofilin family)
LDFLGEDFMWRKSTEAKPASPAPPASNTPAPAAISEKPKQTPQAVPQQSSPVPAANAAASAEVAAVPAQVKAAPVAPPPPPAPQPVRAAEASTISAGLRIKGEITGTSDLTVDGEAQGKIRLTNGRVTVGQNGRVNADIDAREILVHGTVQGNLKASESVRLGASGRVEGSILTPRIGIDDGARLRGNVEMVRPGETQGNRSEQAKPVAAAHAASSTASQE